MSAAAKIYAKALFELGQEKSQLDVLQKELTEFSESCEANASLKSILSGSGINPNDRRAVLAGVLQAMKVSETIRRFLETLLARGRVVELPAILRELDLMIERSQGVQAGEVRSAVELSAEELSVLSASLAKRVGSKVRLTQVVDASLLGGMVATVSGKTFDASLRSQLERFKNELI